MQQHHIAMLGTGLIGDFYTMSLHALARPGASSTRAASVGLSIYFSSYSKNLFQIDFQI